MITVPVHRGTGKNKMVVARAMIDDGEKFLTGYEWRLHSDGYVYRCHKGRTLYLHREVLWYDGPDEVNHKNGNPLDNQEHNLEVASRSLNKLNPNDRVRGASRFRGVTMDGRPHLRKPWRGKVKVEGTLYCTKRFATELETALALNDLRESLGLPIDQRVYGPLPSGYGNPFARDRRRAIPADVKPL